VIGVYRVAEAGIGVDQYRDVAGSSDVRRRLGELLPSHDAHVRQAVDKRGCLGAGEEERLVAGLLAHARVQGAEAARHLEDLRVAEQTLESGSDALAGHDQSFFLSNAAINPNGERRRRSQKDCTTINDAPKALHVQMSRR